MKNPSKTTEISFHGLLAIIKACPATQKDKLLAEIFSFAFLEYPEGTQIHYESDKTTVNPDKALDSAFIGAVTESIYYRLSPHLKSLLP